MIVVTSATSENAASDETVTGANVGSLVEEEKAVSSVFVVVVARPKETVWTTSASLANGIHGLAMGVASGLDPVAVEMEIVVTTSAGVMVFSVPFELASDSGSSVLSVPPS